MISKSTLIKSQVGSNHPNYRFRYAFIAIIWCTLFIGTSIWHTLGWRTGAPNAASYQQLLPQFYIALFLLILSNKQNILVTRREEINIIIAIGFLILFMIMMGNLGALSTIPNGLLLPVLISVIVRGMPIQIVRLLKPLAINFVVFNSLFAMLERLVYINFFPFTGSEIGGGVVDGVFRSTAFQNHPLNNALMTSTVMSFLLIDDRIKLSKKYFLICLGFIALLCFNTRSSIVLWFVILAFHFLGILLSGKKNVKKVKPFLIIGMMVIVACVSYLLFAAGWGNRLLEIDLTNDESAAARLEIWSLFDYYSIKDFLFGSSLDSYSKVLEKVGMARVENYWLIFVLRYGVLFTVVITLLYAKLFKRLFKGYKQANIIFISGVFLILSSTNNSLAFSEQPLSVFIICCYMFSPLVQKKVKHHTYANP